MTGDDLNREPLIEDAKMQALNIQIYVDVVQLLLDHNAGRAAFMFDDSPGGGDGQGTLSLRSPVLPGQLVRWTVTPVDVQTPIWISGIEFMPKAADEDAKPADVARTGGEAADETETKADALSPYSAPVWSKSWNGFVPAWELTCGGEYAYRVIFSFGGVSEIAMEGPALVYPAIAPPAEAPASEDQTVATKEG